MIRLENYSKSSKIGHSPVLVDKKFLFFTMKVQVYDQIRTPKNTPQVAAKRKKGSVF